MPAGPFRPGDLTPAAADALNQLWAGLQSFRALSVQHPLNLLRGPGGFPAAVGIDAGPGVTVVKVTGAASGVFYPATVESYAAAADAWTSGTAVWVRDANGLALASAVRYLARANGDAVTEAGSTRPVYVTAAAVPSCDGWTEVDVMTDAEIACVDGEPVLTPTFTPILLPPCPD